MSDYQRLKNYGEFCLMIAEKFGGKDALDEDGENFRQFLQECEIGWHYYNMGAVDAADDIQQSMPDIRRFFKLQNDIKNL